jgi:hypothetical protein
LRLEKKGPLPERDSGIASARHFVPHVIATIQFFLIELQINTAKRIA